MTRMRRRGPPHKLLPLRSAWRGAPGVYGGGETAWHPNLKACRNMCTFLAGLAEWIGLVIVVQNIVGSLFNSHLFDFVQGWVYVFGVGVAGGIALKNRALEKSAGAAP